MRPTYRRKAGLILFSVAVLLAGGAAGVRGQSALDGFDPNANGAVNVVVVQPDGKILIGGEFTTLSPNGGVAVTRNHIARLNPDGTLDTAFDPNANLVVRSIAVQADGKVLAGGDFTTIGGQSRGSRIARLDATTGLADSWNPIPGGFVVAVNTIAVQADGKILVGGDFSHFGGQTGQNSTIARLDPVTGQADSWNPSANNPVNTIVVQTDGKILAGGRLTTIGGQTRNHIARLDPVTGLADSWDPNANGLVLSIAVQADGKILAGGQFFGANSIGGASRNNIARLDPVTGLADSWDPNGPGAGNSINSIAVQADGKILAGGGFTTIGGQTRNNIARLDRVTGLADSFDPKTSSDINTIAVQQDGKILAGGLFTTLAPNGGATVTRNSIARLETDGLLDQTLDLSIPAGSFVIATAVQPDGKILIGGFFSSVLGVTRNNIARLNTNGTLDTAFDPNANSVVRSIAVQPDGKVLAGGNFTTIGGLTRNNIARLDATSGAADSFDPNANGLVQAIVVQMDGKILAGGNFTTIGGLTRNNIARLDATSGAADSFDPNANGSVRSIAVQTDGKVLAGGDFNGANSIGGQTRNYIARLDAVTGAADLSFDPNANGLVRPIAVQADGKILAGGDFNGVNSIGGQTRNYIARLDATTGAADSFDPNASSGTFGVQSIAVQADGKILAGGFFTSIGGQTRNFIARLDATTGSADSFDPNPNSNGPSLTVQADGKILAGGTFTTIGGQTRNFFARLSNDTAALQNLAVTQTTITWTRGGSSPQFTRVTFESSADNVNYTPLGNGTASGSNWTLTGLNLPTGQNFYIRARGYYGSGQRDGSASITESVRDAFLTPRQFINISSRASVGTGDNVAIGGFIININPPNSGVHTNGTTATKRVLIRGIGPSLAVNGTPVTGRLMDPVIELHDHTGAIIATNDDWRVPVQNQTDVEATGLPPSDDHESALVATLDANVSYTAILRGKNNTTGIGLVEIYDLEATNGAYLANISTRAQVLTGDDVLIGGIVVRGGDAREVLVRAIGPSLANFNVNNPLLDPQLDLHDAQGTLLAHNDNWKEEPDGTPNPGREAAINATGLAPSNEKEAAILFTPAPGSYTAIVSGVAGTTGVGLVEAYRLGPPAP